MMKALRKDIEALFNVDPDLDDALSIEINELAVVASVTATVSDGSRMEKVVTLTSGEPRPWVTAGLLTQALKEIDFEEEKIRKGRFKRAFKL